MKFLISFIIITGIQGCFYSTHENKTVADSTPIEAANNFISSLNETQKKKALYDFNNAERYNWNYIPKSRNGISYKDLNDDQKKAAFVLLSTALSESGVKKTKAIMDLESVLKAIESRGKNDNYRDPENYYITIFGKPSEDDVWGWRFEGHHISFNFSAMTNTLVSGTPGFMGSNPAIVPEGPQKGKQVLKDEELTALSLLHSLSDEQKSKAILQKDVPSEILTYADKIATIKSNDGIAFNELNPLQQKKLLDLLDVYLGRYKKQLADDMKKDIRDAGMENLRFTWIGPEKTGTGFPHYYRIQGPTIIIELDNTQNNANHVHSVVRDLKRDFGGDALIDHLKEKHRQ